MLLYSYIKTKQKSAEENVCIIRRLFCSLQQPTLSDMTMYELNFSLLVEQMLSKIVDPAYRQITVEVSILLYYDVWISLCW